MNRTMKLWLGICAGGMALVLVFAVIVKNTFSPSYFTGYKTVEQLKNSNIRVADMHHEAGICGYEDVTFQDVVDMYIEAMETMFDCAFVVRATGNICCRYECVAQEFEIKDVIRGEGEAGKTCYCFFGRARLENKGSKLWSYGVNFMQPEKTYLLFCNKTNMSKYSDTSYYYQESGICYLALDFDNVAVVCDLNGTTFYRDVCEAEFFADSEKTALRLTDLKKELLEHFLPDYPLGM